MQGTLADTSAAASILSAWFGMIFEFHPTDVFIIVKGRRFWACATDTVDS